MNVGRAYPSRLRWYAVAMIAIACPIAAGALLRVASREITLGRVGGVLVLFMLTLAAELRPVPLDVEGERLVSTAFVFVVSASLIAGWGWGVLIGATSIAVAQLPGRVGALRLAFNSAVYTLAAAGCALPALVLGGHSHGAIHDVALSFAAGTIFAAVNIVLVSLAITFATGLPLQTVADDHLRTSGPAFSVMVFVVAQAVLFWRQSPFLLLLVGAPLVALSLYQRSAVRRRVAERAATRDNLTGLGNHRAYQNAVETLVDRAVAGGSVVTLYLVDVDRFKQVNDRNGHTAGDAVLEQLGALLEELAPGCGYRIGGDEFAVLFTAEQPQNDENFPLVLLERVERMALPEVAEGITISVGVAHAPEHASEPGELKKRADLALYRSKRNGKNQASVFGSAELEGDADTRWTSDEHSLVVERLLAVLEARDSRMSEHSAAVGGLAHAIGARLGLDQPELEALHLAGLLHDLGKIGISDVILNKPAALTSEERAAIKSHPTLAFELLDGLELAPVDEWILHHHERWDGAGYPSGLAGAEIPFGSRILHVADAFHAMTSDRPYGSALSVPAALGELRDHAGSQFDPLVVDALERTLAAKESGRRSLAGVA
jgi:diguanylate cyclase (GGDEF)-like protein